MFYTRRPGTLRDFLMALYFAHVKYRIDQIARERANESGDQVLRGVCEGDFPRNGFI